MSRKSYAVFGLGRYGLAVAEELVANGAQVMAVDSNPESVESAADRIPLCKCADITDPEVIKQLGISDFDTVIVAMADNLEASVMAVSLVKEAGVPHIIAKCGNEIHKRILTKVGADKVVFPETESGIRLAKNLLSSGFLDIADLSDDVSIVEIEIKKDWIGKTLTQLDLRKKYSINVIAENINGKINVSLDPAKPLTKGTKLVIIAETKVLSKIIN